MHISRLTMFKKIPNIDDDILANVSLQCCKNANKLL